MGIEGQSVDLAAMSVEAGQLQTRPMQVIDDDAAIRGSGCDDGVELAVGPLHILDGQLVFVFGWEATGHVVRR